MRFHDGSAHGQAHSHSIGFGRDEWLKQLRSNLIYKTRSRISDADLHHPALDKACGNDKVAPWLVLHGFDCVPK